MLIRSIRAENFMRFSRLEVLDLPARGLIGIEGPNESGKSTLGEVLLFAFFGKTRLATEAPVLSLVRWGADVLSVEVEFCVEPLGEQNGEESGNYLIYRQIDQQGTHFVKILELPGRKEVALGNIQVAEFMARRVRFDFKEFQQSFYHDQFENRKTQLAPAAFLEAAIGIKHMRESIQQLQRDTEPMEREFTYYQKEITRNDAQMEKHARNVAKLPDLTARAGKLEESHEQAVSRLGDLKRREAALREEIAMLQERVKAVEGFLELPVEVLVQEATNMLARDQAASARRLQIELESGSRSLLEGAQALLTELRESLLAVLELRRAVKEDLEESSDLLSADAKKGPVAERGKLLVQADGLARSARHRSKWVILALLAFLASAAAACVFLPALGGRWLDPASAWGGSLASLGEGWRVAMASGLGALSLSCLWLSFHLLRKNSRERCVRTVALQTSEGFGAEIAGAEQARSALEEILALDKSREISSFVARAAECQSRRVARRASELKERHGGLMEEGGDGSLKQALASMQKRDRDARSQLMAAAQRIEKELAEEEEGLKKLQAERARIDGEMRECQSQTAKKEALEARNQELEGSATSIRESIALRILAAGLLDETIAAVRSKVAPALARFVKGALPRLTSGRYRELKVEEDLEIRVFSSDKNDFLSIHELSGGTSEALSLALRLALSQALISARARQGQFVFLDEPFKMMDGERAADTLRLLRQLSPDLRQFLVIQPNFSDGERALFDCLIRTSTEVASLEARCDAQPDAAATPSLEGASATRLPSA